MDLQQLRREIDQVDRDLVVLLEQRLDIAAAIGQVKKDQGLPVLDAGREQAKIREIQAMCRPETAPLLGELFRSVIRISRTYEAQRSEEEEKAP